MTSLAVPLDGCLPTPFGFVYIWRDRLTNMFYIGSHKGAVDDGYICSSPKMLAQYRTRHSDFKRRILYFSYVDRIDLLAAEQRWLNLIPKEEFARKYYNHSASAKGILLLNEDARKEANKKSALKNKGRKYPPRSEQWRANIARGRKGKGVGRVLDEETREKIRKSNTGKRHSEETKKKIAENTRRQFSSVEARQRHADAHRGYQFSDEHRANMSKALTGRIGWSAGMQWITDGIVEIQVPKDYVIHSSFVRGRKNSKRMVPQW